ncbi:MAG TPA: homoserine kinase [Polyangiaceae bacterium]|nr:homoserine kinase [Polyangiaceae bacterium]
MALLTELPLSAAQELGREHGIEITRLEALVAGSVNSNFIVEDADGRRYFARLYEEQGSAGAERELALLEGLSRAGVPVARPLPRTSSAGISVWSGKPFALFPWLDGEILCQGRVREEHCRAVGEALARMHLSGYDAARLGSGRFNPSDMLARLEQVEHAAERPELLPDVRRVRELYERYDAQRDPSLPRGVVHGDLFRDNTLWSDGRLVSLLDFESAFHGPLAYDLAVTIEAWCYGDEFRPELVRAMAVGYASLRRFEAAELASFAVEAALGCLRFATSRITDFALRTPPGVAPARDFRRFLQRLAAIEGGALEPALTVLACD